MIFQGILGSGEGLTQALSPETDYLVQPKELPDPTEVETFLDTFVAEQMETFHVPGLVVTIVKEDQVFLAKGYGYADLETGRPMTPQTALRVGSVSKPVTATAVLQLVEQGRIDLNAPINSYLPHLELTDSFEEPSTVAQHLTHRAGYDDTILQTHAPTQEEWRPLAEYLAAELPPRAMPPDQVLSYSSWDYALLGYLIEQVTGTPYEQYIADNMFQPLGMMDSTYMQPLPTPIAEKMAVGYQYSYEHAAIEPIPHDWVNMSPGVALVSTGADMAKFMLALLGEEQLAESRILDPATVDLILHQQVTDHPTLNGRTYAFAEINIDNKPAIYHDGNGIGFTARMLLIPEHKLGLFISVNARALEINLGPSLGSRFIRQLSTAFFETYIPDQPGSDEFLPPLVDAKERASRYEGTYVTAHASQQTFLKLEALMDSVSVQDNGDGTIQIGAGRYTEVDPLLFQNVENPRGYVAFLEDAQGQVKYLTFGGTGSYIKGAWYQSPSFHLGFIVTLLGVFFSGIIGLPLLYLRRRQPFASNITRGGYWVAGIVSLLNVVFFTLFFITLFQTDILLFFKMIPTGFKIVLLLALLNSGLALCLPAFTYFIWKEEALSRIRLIHYTIVTIAALGFIWFVLYWNLLL